MATDKKPISLRMAPAIKAEGERRAKEENRSFASYLERLVVEDAKRHPPELDDTLTLGLRIGG